MADPRDILGERGRTISNIDRQMASDPFLQPPQQIRPPRSPMVGGEVPVFAEGLAVDIENLEKKN